MSQNQLKDCIAMDLDGTLTDCSHRLHLIETKPKNWKAFFAGIPNDQPVPYVLEALHSYISRGMPVFFTTARPETTRKDTAEWLEKHGINSSMYVEILMRDVRDHRVDHEVKRDQAEYIKSLGYTVFAAYDDKDNVITECWEALNVVAFKVNAKAEGSDVITISERSIQILREEMSVSN